MLVLERANDEAVGVSSSVTKSDLEDAFTTDSGREQARSITIRQDERLIAIWSIYFDKADRFFAGVAIDPELPDDFADDLRARGYVWTEQASRDNLSFFGLDKARLMGWAWSTDQETIDAMEAAGYENERCYIDMIVDLPLAEPVNAPADVTVRQLDLGDLTTDDAKLAHEIITETFRDHHDFIERTFEVFMQRRTDSHAFDPQGWFVAEIDGKPAGVSIHDNSYVETKNAAYIANLGTLRWARGRGVAKALLADSFARAQAQGRSQVKLNVDAESPTGATHLYEKVGMRRDKVGFVFQKHFSL